MKITNAWICRIIDEKIEPVFGDLNIDGGRIISIEEKSFEPKNLNYSSAISEDTINAGGRVLTIPNINFHDHFYSRLAKGLQINGPMDNFYNILKSLWWKLDKLLTEEMIVASAQLGILDSIKNGVTYIFDHHSSPADTEGSLETIADVFSDFGIRGVVCFETTDRNGHQLAEDGLKENQNFLKNHVNDNIKALLGLHASFTVSNETLQKTAELVKENDTGIHIHLCEDNIDRELSQKNYNDLPLNRLIKYNLLNEKSILSHGIHLTKKEYDIIEQHKSAIAFNPDSNMNNAVGLPDFNVISEDLPLLMSTDGMNSNPAKSLKEFFLLLRHSGKSFDETFLRFQKVYVNQLRFVKIFFPDFTQLNVNDRADMIVWDYIPPTPFTDDNFWGHFIYGILESRIRDVIHNGNVLLKNFELMFDADKYLSNIVKEGYKLYKNFNTDKL